MINNTVKPYLYSDPKENWDFIQTNTSSYPVYLLYFYFFSGVVRIRCQIHNRGHKLFIVMTCSGEILWQGLWSVWSWSWLGVSLIVFTFFLILEVTSFQVYSLASPITVNSFQHCGTSLFIQKTLFKYQVMSNMAPLAQAFPAWGASSWPGKSRGLAFITRKEWKRHW